MGSVLQLAFSDDLGLGRLACLQVSWSKREDCSLSEWIPREAVWLHPVLGRPFLGV